MKLSHTKDNTRKDQQEKYRQARITHWNEIARQGDKWAASAYYHQRLAEIYRFLVVPNQKVLELGCGQGDLIAALKPSVGVGIDFSGEMIRCAQPRHPELRFIKSDAQDLGCLQEEFDVVIMSDLVNDVWDVQEIFEQIGRLVTPRTRLIINTYSRLWELPLAAMARSGLARPKLGQNWLTVEDINNLLNLANFEPIRAWHEILLPLPIPLLCTFFNRFVVKLWPFKYFALTNFIVARPRPQLDVSDEKPLVSVIIPTRNEAGNIPQIFTRTPKMGRDTELVFVEGHSTDGTYECIEREIAAHPECLCQLHQQSGVGKGDAVRLGFAQARGDILMILDADLTVPPETLPRFYAALHSGQGEFINGVRLVYPIEDQAMRFLNLVGNKFFSLAFSWLLGQSIKDTLCGTKVLWKYDYEVIAANRAFLGDFDPFGDFDLIFGAARLDLKIVDLPVRYAARTYGETNIQRWRHGWLLLRMAFFAARRLKFV